MNPNFGKTELNLSFVKGNKLNIFKRKIKTDSLLPEFNNKFSRSNYSTKNKKYPLFFRTSNLYFSNNSMMDNSNNTNFTQIKVMKRLNSRQKLLKIKKIKLKKSLSEMFQNNDIDLVRNLNIDSLAQFNNNIKLKENLMNLKENYFEKEKKKKVKNIIFDYNDNSERNEDNDFEEQKNRTKKLPILNRNLINKSYEMLQAKNKELKLEMSENLEKEAINKIKLIKKEEEKKNIEKKEHYERIKEINQDIEEIEEENEFMKNIYLKVINNISKDKNNGIDIFDEIIKYKIKSKFYNNKKNTRQDILQVLNIKKKKNINGELDESSIDNEKIKERTKLKHRSSKKLENFVKNMKKSDKKKKYDNFKKEQENKINDLKEEKKKVENEISKLEKEIEKYKNEKKIIIDKLMMSYKESLFKGKNVKKEGLVWIIKAIWNLGEDVPMSFMPEFLDSESIEFLFKLAKKQNSMDDLIKKILEIKMKLKKKIISKRLSRSPSINDENKSNDDLNNNKTLTVKEKLILKKEKEFKISENEKKKDIYKELVNQFRENDKKIFEIMNMSEIQIINKIQKKINKLKEEISEMKKIEINRIYKCFIEKDYENIYHTNIDTVLAALIGLDEKDTEVNKHNPVKKNHVTSIK